MADFEIKEGNDYNITLRYKDSLGVIVDITGASARMMIRKGVYSPVLLTKAAIINGPAGTMLFSLTAAETASTVEANKELTAYKYDVEFTSSTGKIITLVDGEVIFKKPITRG